MTDRVEQFDVAIIGGGIMGIASAYELARAGVRCVLLERDELGSGSTSRAAGGVRSQFSDATNIALGAHSLEVFRDFRSRFDQDIDFVGSGYLFLLDNEADAADFESNVATQRAMGQHSTMLTPSQAKELSPVISTDGLVAAAFNPDDAHCTPESVVAGYARAARRLGADIRRHTAVTDIAAEGGRVTGVHTDSGFIAAEAVVCAAGTWSGQVAGWAGVDLPVQPLRRHIIVTEPVPFDARKLPFTIDFTTSFYFHSEGSGLLLGAPEEVDLWDFNTRNDPGWVEHLGELMAARAPGLADVELGRGWTGLYEITPDHNALIGEAADVQGFFYACGFSGHGFLQGPAVGQVMRDMYLGRTPFVDVSGLSVERFATADQTRRELNFV